MNEHRVAIVSRPTRHRVEVALFVCWSECVLDALQHACSSQPGLIRCSRAPPMFGNDPDDFEERLCEVCGCTASFYVFDKCACCQQEVCEDCLVPFMHSSAQQSMCSCCRWVCSTLLQVLWWWYDVWCLGSRAQVQARDRTN
jgi:hypothetical protein